MHTHTHKEVCARTFILFCSKERKLRENERVNKLD